MVLGSQTLLLKTFGEITPKLQTCEVVQLRIRSLDGLNIYSTYVVLQICHPVSCQVINITKGTVFIYLQGLHFADNPTDEEQNEMPIDILVGSDQYWSFIVKGPSFRDIFQGQYLHLTKLGYVLSVPVHCQGNSQFSINFVSTHVLITNAQPIDVINLKNELSRFWGLEHVGIQKQEPIVYDKFLQDIKFVDNRYQTSLPFKD